MKSARLLAIFTSFLKLGFTAFGGPVAHLGYFHEEFVRRLRWLDEREYADLVALCQFLPGPASTQVAFAIGLKMGGKPGAFAAWLGFTLPSAVLMIGFALGLAKLGDLRASGWLAGLKLAAVAVVADAIWTMSAKLCPDRERVMIALTSAAVLLVMPDTVWQVLCLLFGGMVGWMLFRTRITRKESAGASGNSPHAGWPYLVVFAVLLAGLPVLKWCSPAGWLGLADGFYRSGSLVFGGGHVLLPLLEKVTVAPGWIDQETFLAGYGAAQALPGPLFTFAGFLGAKMNYGPGGLAGGILGIVAISLPSWLLILGAIPYWNRLRHLDAAQAALMGTNAAVVGLLLAAFYSPIWTTAITGPAHLAFALAGIGLLRFARIPTWLLVLLSAGAGAMLFS